MIGRTSEYEFIRAASQLQNRNWNETRRDLRNYAKFAAGILGFMLGMQIENQHNDFYEDRMHVPGIVLAAGSLVPIFRS